MHHHDNTIHSLRSGRTYTHNPSSRLRPSITVSTSFSTPPSQTEVQKSTSTTIPKPLTSPVSRPNPAACYTCTYPRGHLYDWCDDCQQHFHSIEKHRRRSLRAQQTGRSIQAWVLSLPSEFTPQDGPCGWLSWCTRKCGQIAGMLQVIWDYGKIWKIGGWILEFLFWWIKLA